MLELDHVALDDLVIIGYGSKSRRNVTTAISTVSQEQISKLAATTPTLDGLLQGTVKAYWLLPQMVSLVHLSS